VRAILTVVAVAMLGCGHAERSPDAGPQRVDGPPQDPIAVRVGEREVRVRCGFACGEVGAELARLHAGCVRDPMSTPHHVTDRPELVAFGCCTVARTAYEAACGIEGSVERCASEWGARCDSGRLHEGSP
jgi:hypothetical protein